MINRKEAPDYQDIDKIHYLKAKPNRLSNNLPVYTINAGTQELVRIDLIIKAGTWHQKSPLVASATNAQLSEGTKKYTTSEISEKLDFYGAHNHTTIDYHNAGVSLYSLNKYLPQTLEIFEEIIKNPVFPEKELVSYIANKKQNLIVELTKVKTLARRKFSETIFGADHPYGAQANPNDYENLTSRQLSDFHNGLYKADNCKMVVSGKVNKDTISLLNNHFGGNDWLGGNQISEKKFETTLSREKQFIIEKEGAVQSAIRIGKELFDKTHPDFQKLQIVNTILGGYFGSRLMTNIREDKGYTYGIGSIVLSLKNTGYFVIVSEVGANVCKDAINEVKKELKRLRTELVPDAELTRVKSYMLGEMLRSFDGPFSLADAFLGVDNFGLDYNYYDEFVKTIKRISAEEIKDLANKYLHEDSMTEVIAGKY